MSSRAWAAVVAALLAAYALIVTLDPGDAATYLLTWRVESALLYAAIGAGAAWAVVRRRADAAGYALLAASVGAYAVGALVLRATSPDPLSSFDDTAVAQAFWLASFPLAYAAIAYVAGRQMPFLRRTVLIDGVAGTLAITAAATLVLLHRTDESAGEVGEVVALLMPASELVLAVVALSLAVLVRGPGGRDWAVLGAGFALICVGNWSIALSAAEGDFTRDGVLSVLTPAGNAVLVLACLTAQASIPCVERRPGIALLAMPAACLALALTVLVADIVDPVAPSARALAVAAIVLIAVRGAFTVVSLERLFESRRFEMGFQEANVGMALISPGQRWERLNGALCAMLGRDAAALTGRHVGELTCDGDGATLEQLLSGTPPAPGGDEPVVRFLRPDGAVVEAQVTATSIDDPAGSGERWSFAQFQDVTDRRTTARHKSAIAALVARALTVTDPRALAEMTADVVTETLGVAACAVLRDDEVVASSPRTLAGPVEWSYVAPVGGGTDHRETIAVRATELSPSDEELLRAAGGVLASALDRLSAETELRHVALHDALTGLPNRALLHTLLDQALAVAARRRTTVGVLLLDVDGFKTVNDTLGHAAGDALLQTVGERLCAAMRDEDVIARLGGDEFAMVCGDWRADAAIAETASRILDVFAGAFVLGGREQRLSASIGIAVAREGEGRAADLIRDADVAMYRAKGRGGGRYEVFDATLRSDLLRRVEVEDGLRRALAEGELRLHYQPIVDLTHGTTHAAEALLRWEHPERGLLGPGAFLGIAETSDLIVDVGRWALGEACRQIAAWSARGAAVPRVSVNIAARHVTPGLVRDVVAALERARVEPAQLGIELTESSLMDPDATVPVVGELRDLGVHVALDDFGTGYSSLAYLERYALDTVKLDRTFLREASTARGRGLLRAAIDMGIALDLFVVAEGIETPDQLALLRELGCPFGQGYRFSRPVPAHAAGDVLFGAHAVAGAVPRGT